MNQLTKMFEGHKLTIIEKGGEPIFKLSDVCRILGIGNPTDVKNRLDHGVVSIEVILDSLNRQQKATFVNEDGLYDVILDSRKPEAKKFRKWITSEVVPSIRKTGSYNTVDTSQLSPELQIMDQMVKALANNELEAKQAKQMALEANKTANNISNIVSINNVGWREKVGVILKRIAKKWTGVEPYQSVIRLSYERLEERAGCRLNIRLNNRKERAIAQGMTKTYVNKINKLDVISEEKRLVEIYIQVVKEMAIEFKVDVSSLEGVV